MSPRLLLILLLATCATTALSQDIFEQAIARVVSCYGCFCDKAPQCVGCPLCKAAEAKVDSSESAETSAESAANSDSAQSSESESDEEADEPPPAPPAPAKAPKPSDAKAVVASESEEKGPSMVNSCFPCQCHSYFHFYQLFSGVWKYDYIGPPLCKDCCLNEMEKKNGEGDDASTTEAPTTAAAGEGEEAAAEGEAEEGEGAPAEGGNGDAAANRNGGATGAAAQGDFQCAQWIKYPNECAKWVWVPAQPQQPQTYVLPVPLPAPQPRQQTQYYYMPSPRSPPALPAATNFNFNQLGSFNPSPLRTLPTQTNRKMEYRCVKYIKYPWKCAKYQLVYV